GCGQPRYRRHRFPYSVPSLLDTSDGTSKTTAFQEWVQGWHADHVMKHNPAAIECFLLMAFLAFILFHAFLYLNVKQQLRKGKSKDFWTRVMAAEIYKEFA